MKSIVTILFSFGIMAQAALAKPTVVVVPLQAGKNIPTTIAQGYDKSLRGATAKLATVTSTQVTVKSMNSTGMAPRCSTDDCGAKLAKAASQRFVLFSQVTNDDEIYQVVLTLYDGALSKRVAKVKESCELCAANEVHNTIAAAAKKLAKPYSVPAPKVAVAATKKPAGAVSIEVRTTPTGAEVKLGDVSKGKAPVSFNVKPGSHTIVISKPGFKSIQRKISALDRTVKIAVKLQAGAPPVVAAKKPVKPAAKPVAKPDAPPAVAEPLGSSYNGLAWGMAAGGLALMGVGTWLVLLDGEITCTDGRGRRECPNVYNTNGFGLTAFGIGGILVGAGGALIIKEIIRSNRQQARTSNRRDAFTFGAAPLENGAAMTLMGRF